jgi:hypothetical protein
MGLLSIQLAPDLSREFSDPVGQHAKRGPRQSALVTFRPYLASWLPDTGHQSSPEPAHVKRELGTEFFFCVVIGKEVPDEGRLCSGTEADAVATVVARLVLQRCVSRC